MGNVNKRILDGRKELRHLYDKYRKRLHEVCTDIDHFLKELGEQDER